MIVRLGLVSLCLLTLTSSGVYGSMLEMAALYTDPTDVPRIASPATMIDVLAGYEGAAQPEQLLAFPLSHEAVLEADQVPATVDKHLSSGITPTHEVALEADRSPAGIVDQRLPGGVTSTGEVALEADRSPAETVDKRLPGVVTPSHVYAKMVQLRQIVQRLLRAQGMEPPTMELVAETELEPLHVYQLVMGSVSRVQAFGEHLGELRLPTVVSSPRPIAPRDVQYLVEMMLTNLQDAARVLDVKDALPTRVEAFTEKTSTDVYGVIVEVFIALSRLAGSQEISPSEVYAEMVRATADVRAILQRIDQASRYRIDAPASEVDRKPRHVFARCLVVRREINNIRQTLQLTARPLPSLPAWEVEPMHVFLQTQIIIAELNLLKIHFHTGTSTPLSIPVTGKTPTHVHQQALLVNHLLQQIPVVVQYASK